MMKFSPLEYANKAQRLCALPDVYLRLKEVLEEKTSTLNDIAEIVMLDPALSSTLLKLANSAIFNFPREVDSIPKALTILGLQEVNNLVNTYGTTKAFSAVNPDIINLDRFWEISVDCGLLCKFLAKKKGIKNTESLFLSGLLHNVGELAIMQTAPEEVQYCEAYDSSQPPWQRQQDVFGFTFADCTVELLTLWQLPESLIKPIREYHSAYHDDLDQVSSLLYVASRTAILNSHPGMYCKKSFIGQHILDDLSITMDDILEAIDFCNLEGLTIMSALKLKN